MSFVDDLVECDPGLFRQFHRLEFGRFSLSIQASEYHYCEPRETLHDLSGYTAWECALFEDEEWVKVHDDPRFARWRDFWEEGEKPVGGYIPTAEVQALVDHLRELAKE